MTKIAQASFTTQLVDLPAGAVLAGYSVLLLLAGTAVAEPTIVANKETPVSFTITAPGDYTVQVQRLLQDGSAFLAAASSAPFTVVPDQVEVPLAVTVTLTDAA